MVATLTIRLVDMIEMTTMVLRLLDIVTLVFKAGIVSVEVLVIDCHKCVRQGIMGVVATIVAG